MLFRPVRQAPRVIARLASSANEATSSANEEAKKSSSPNMAKMALAVGAVGFGVSKLRGRSEKTNMSSESDYPPNGLADSVKKLPEWIQKGCGNDEYVCEEKGATFLGGNMPAECPDLSKHNSFFSENMTPELYNKLKDKKTKLGVTLGHCIKTGVDNPGHPMIKTCGIVAGDEESYELFKELFDPIISARHGGYAADAKHPTDLDVNKLSDTKIDPTGKYVLTSRCRTGRSVRGFRLPPTCSFEERREIEKVVVNGLLSLDGKITSITTHF